MRACVASACLLLPASALAQAVPTPLHGPLAFDRGFEVRAVTARSRLDTQIGLGLAYGSDWLRVAVSLALDAAPAPAIEAAARVPERSKERYVAPGGQGGGAWPHLGFAIGGAPTLYTLELDHVRRIGFELLISASVDVFARTDDGTFPLRFSPEAGVGVRVQIIQMLYVRAAGTLERDLTGLASELSDAEFVLRTALQLGASLPEPAPVPEGTPSTTDLRASFAYERPLQDSLSRPGSWFLTVGVVY